MATYVVKQEDDASSEQTLYTVPAVTVSKIVSIFIANRSTTTAATFNITHNVGGGATANTDYLYKSIPLAPSDTFLVTTPIFANTADKIKILSSTANVTFTLYAQET